MSSRAKSAGIRRKRLNNAVSSPIETPKPSTAPASSLYNLDSTLKSSRSKDFHYDDLYQSEQIPYNRTVSPALNTAASPNRKDQKTEKGFSPLTSPLNITPTDSYSIDKTEILSPNMRRDRYNKRVMEYVGSDMSDILEDIASPGKKINFSAFEYVLENQLNDYELANSQAGTIVNELISKGLLCRKRIALAISMYNKNVNINIAPQEKEFTKSKPSAHDLVTKLLRFWDIFQDMQNDLRALQQHMLYQINHNDRIKDEAENERRELQEKYSQYDQHHEKKEAALNNTILKTKHELHQIKAKVEDDEALIQKLQVEKDILLKQVTEQQRILETAPDLETQYLRAARSIVTKNNISIHQREMKLQKLKDDVKELNYWKTRTQELQYELNITQKKNRYYEKEMKRMDHEKTTFIKSQRERKTIDSPRKHPVLAPSEIEGIINANNNVSIIESNNSIDNKNIGTSDDLGSKHRPTSAPMTRDNLLASPREHIQSSTSHLKADIVGSVRPSTAHLIRNHSGMKQAPSQETDNNSINTNSGHNDDHRDKMLMKRNNDLKNQIQTLSTKLAFARAYPLLSSVPPTQNTRHRNETVSRRAIIAKKRHTDVLGKLMRISSQKNIDNDKITNSESEIAKSRDDSYSEDSADDSSYNTDDLESSKQVSGMDEEDPALIEMRKERRDEILKYYEERIKQNKISIAKEDIYRWRENLKRKW